MIYNSINIFNSIYNTVPTGTILMMFGDIPSGFLLCDGSQYSISEYPELAKLYKKSSNSVFNVPDFRECALVGAGTNDTFYEAYPNTYDEDDESKLRKHDTYSVNQFKDDTLQTHYHNYIHTRKATGQNSWFFSSQRISGQGSYITSQVVNEDSNNPVRVGTTTHGKQMGIKFIIKY